MTSFNPVKMEFTMGAVGSTEQKMDMTLDDIIKQTRKTKPPRLPIKGRFRNPNAPGQKAANTAAARATLQRSVAARSATLRQGKFAEVRARNGAGNFAATQAAGKRAFATAIAPRNGAWMKSSDVRRNNFARQRPVPGNPFSAAAGNMKISVVNNGSKIGGQRFQAVPFRRRNGPNVRNVPNVRNGPTNVRNGPNVPARHVQTGQPSNERMDVDFAQNQATKQKPRTLDSLFAEIKERRNTQPMVVQPFTSVERASRRGGRNGFPGRRRQGGQ